MVLGTIRRYLGPCEEMPPYVGVSITAVTVYSVTNIYIGYGKARLKINIFLFLGGMYLLCFELPSTSIGCVDNFLGVRIPGWNA